MATSLSSSGEVPWHIAVLIPAHNEEALLPRCLESVKRCARETAARVEIIVAVDSSTDSSLALARRLLGPGGFVLETNVLNVGKARQLAAEKALSRLSVPLNRCWLANTDADSMVPPDWLDSQLQLAQAGIEAVAGIVDVDHFSDHHQVVKARFESSYHLFPDGSHPHVHGANLGVRADAYCRAGGWNNLETAEDWDLWKRLIKAGATMKSSTAVKVITSGRREGRAPHGFAEALAAHNPGSPHESRST